MQSESSISTTPRIAAGFSGLKLIWDGLPNSGKMCCGLTSPHFKLFLEIMDVMSSGPKRKRTIQTVISAKLKSQHLWRYGGVWMPMASWVTCTSVKAPEMLKGTYRFLDPSNVFFRDVPVYFSKAMPSHIMQCGFNSKRVQVLDWPACIPDLSPI